MRVVLLFSLVATSALGEGFVRSRSQDDAAVCLAWGKRDFTYHYASSVSAELRPAVDAAFGTWRAQSLACSDFTFTRGEDSASEAVGYVRGLDENLVLSRGLACEDVVPENDACAEDPKQAHARCGTKYLCWWVGGKVTHATIALTTTTYNVRTGTIYDADVELNAADHRFTTTGEPGAFDVQNTVTHELGHALGLDHTAGADGTMAESSFPGELEKRALDDGTAEGFCAIYPAGDAPQECNETMEISQHQMRKVVARGGGCDSTGALSSLALALLFACTRRRARGSCAHEACAPRSAADRLPRDHHRPSGS